MSSSSHPHIQNPSLKNTGYNLLINDQLIRPIDAASSISGLTRNEEKKG